MKKKWYSIKGKKSAETTGGESAAIEVMIYDEIGLWGISAAQLIADFKALDDGVSRVVVAINSPGGDVFDGFALNGWLQRLGSRATVRIDGIAASAASVIACGAENVVMAESAMMMIHNPWTCAVGSAEDLRKTADMMDKTRDSIVAAYRRKAPAIDETDLVRMLDEESWLSAAEAVALGLADAIGDAVEIKACRGRTGLMARFKNVPRSLMGESDSDESESERPESESQRPESGSQRPESESAASDGAPQASGSVQEVVKSVGRIITACREAGIQDVAEVIIMNTVLTDEAAVSAEIERVRAVRDLCVVARLPELAGDYAKSGLSVEAVRARLFDKLVETGSGEIGTRVPESGGEAPKAKKPNPTAIYAARKSPRGAKVKPTNPKGREQ